MVANLVYRELILQDLPVDFSARLFQEFRLEFVYMEMLA